MEYFSDTNVCLVCSQTQSISEYENKFMQKCISVFNIDQTHSESEIKETLRLHVMRCECLGALLKC